MGAGSINESWTAYTKLMGYSESQLTTYALVK